MDLNKNTSTFSSGSISSSAPADFLDMILRDEETGFGPNIFNTPQLLWLISLFLSRKIQVIKNRCLIVNNCIAEIISQNKCHLFLDIISAIHLFIMRLRFLIIFFCIIMSLRKKNASHYYNISQSDRNATDSSSASVFAHPTKHLRNVSFVDGY